MIIVKENAKQKKLRIICYLKLNIFLLAYFLVFL